MDKHEKEIKKFGMIKDYNARSVVELQGNL